MATNSIHQNDENELIADEKESIVEESRQNEPVVSSNLAGPMALSLLFHYIMLRCMNGTTNVPVNDILEILSKNNTDCDDDMDELKKLAKQYYLNLYICIINRNEKSFYYLNNSSEQESQQWVRAYLVFDKYNRSFYPFYTRDENNKIRTTFPTNDTYILNLFKNSVHAYKWPVYPEMIQQTHEQNAPIFDQQNVSAINANHRIVNVVNQSENKIKASDVCSLFIQNIQNFIPWVGSQLDSLALSFISSEYQLRNEDLFSPKTICAALIAQLDLLLQLSDQTVKSLESNHISSTNNVHTSMETDDSTMARNASSDNHQQKMLTTASIKTKPSLHLNSQSTTITNTDPPTPVTTNNFNHTIKLPKLKLLNQPTRLWHNRELETLGKGCPAIQVEGGRQRAPLALKLPEEIRNYKQGSYIGVHVTTYDGNEHPQKLAVPKNTKINENHKSMLNTIQCLEFDHKQNVSDQFDPISKGVFFKIDSADLKFFQKKLTFKMVNFYQDVNINKSFIKENKLIWCRLKFAIYIKPSNDEFKCVSPAIYSDLIEQTGRSQLLAVETIFPDSFCERGGQMVFIKLHESVKKSDLRVYCNDKILHENDYQIGETILSFESPVRLPGRTNLEIIIYKNKINEPMTFTRPYHPHDDHPEPCGVINEDK